jgi:7-cyano-7-deazaguanine synthase in queuosine biosynthesis
MNTVNIGPCSIDIHERAGIVMSGGADSSVLLFIMMKYSQSPVNVYTLASKEKFFSSAQISANVIKKCMELTGKSINQHNVIYADKQNNELVFKHPWRDLKSRDISIVYTGLTKLPPIEVYSKFKNPTEDSVFEERNPSVTYNEYSGNKKIYMPFYNLDKKQIHEIYRNFDLEHSLFPLTRSCESLVQNTGHCGTCWWCEERQWAFGRLE